MTTLRIFFTFAFVIFSIFALERALAVEYKPDTREALLFRPEKPTQRLHAPQTCIDRPAKPQRVTWVLRDASGNIIIIGSTVIRRRC